MKEMILKKLTMVQSWKKKVICVIMLAASILFLSGNCFGADTYSALTIFPKNVGVFTVDGKQQFVAFGSSANGLINITRKVSWESSDESKVTIDENGLATIVGGVTMGNVKISCTYPKKGKGMPGPGLLLLRK